MTMTMTRRRALFSGAALPLVAAAGLRASPARAEAAPAAAGLSRDFALGDLRVTAVLAGKQPVPKPHEFFGLNVPQETFDEVSKANFLPTDQAQFFFTPTVVNTGTEVILFDTGLDPAGITAGLASAGYAPGDITHVVLSHLHPDHVGGLIDEAGKVTFEKAAYLTGQTEFDFWVGAANEAFEAKVRPIAERFAFIGEGHKVASGVTALAAHGHTPGHMVFMLEGGGSQILLMADTTNHYVYSLAYPDWEFLYDADKAAAAATRRKYLGMAATDRVPVLGYHMPFPGLGYIEARGEGFHYVPVSYQFG